MGFREQMTQMRREYRKEASRLDAKLEELAAKTDSGFAHVQENFQKVDLALQAVRDQLGATNEAVTQLREDVRETNRTMQGRARLLEDRFGKMLDLVESSVGDTDTNLVLRQTLI